jgi:hypothetical protein
MPLHDPIKAFGDFKCSRIDVTTIQVKEAPSPELGVVREDVVLVPLLSVV